MARNSIRSPRPASAIQATGSSCIRLRPRRPNWKASRASHQPLRMGGAISLPADASGRRGRPPACRDAQANCRLSLGCLSMAEMPSFRTSSLMAMSSTPSYLERLLYVCYRPQPRARLQKPSAWRPPLQRGSCWAESYSCRSKAYPPPDRQTARRRAPAWTFHHRFSTRRQTLPVLP